MAPPNWTPPNPDLAPFFTGPENTHPEWARASLEKDT